MCLCMFIRSHCNVKVVTKPSSCQVLHPNDKITNSGSCLLNDWGIPLNHQERDLVAHSVHGRSPCSMVLQGSGICSLPWAAPALASICWAHLINEPGSRSELHKCRWDDNDWWFTLMRYRLFAQWWLQCVNQTTFNHYLTSHYQKSLIDAMDLRKESSWRCFETRGLDTKHRASQVKPVIHTVAVLLSVMKPLGCTEKTHNGRPEPSKHVHSPFPSSGHSKCGNLHGKLSAYNIYIIYACNACIII